MSRKARRTIYEESSLGFVYAANSGVIILDPKESAKLARTREDSKAGKHLYSLSMYQQLQCLNTIRRSFYREKFYPDMTDNLFQHQKSIKPTLSA